MSVMEVPAGAVRPVDWGEGSPIIADGRAQGVRILTISSLLVAGLVLCAVAWAGAEVLAFRQAHVGEILPGAVVEGVELVGLDRAAALAAVEAALAPRLDRTVALTWLDQRWDVTPRGLGAATDAASLVDEAVEDSAAPGLGRLARMRWLGDRLDFRRTVAITLPLEPVAALVDELAAGIDRPAIDSRLDVRQGGVDLVAEQQGLAVIREPTALGLQQAVVAGTAEVPLGVAGVAPTVTVADLGDLIVVDQSDRAVSLYEGGALVRSWGVAIGTSNHPTPLGEFQVGQKRAAPVWYNPAPTTWGSDMPASIAAGPGNPLGLRALNWVDAEGRDDGIRFHGTQAVASIGRAASHGCVRMRNADVIELFDLVDVGTRIVSIP